MRRVRHVTEVSSIEGALHAEVMGAASAPPMLFVHPNPMDSSCWIFQLAHFSSWFRCVAVDLPGYGRSPRAAAGLTMREIATACWDVVDTYATAQPAVLVGCSVGSTVVQHMYHLRPAATHSIVLSGTGWHPVKHFVAPRVAAYRADGLAYRYQYTLDDFSPQFAATPLARWFARLYCERNDTADLPTILRMFEALAQPDPEWLHAELRAPTLIVSGSLDAAHNAARQLVEQLPDAQLVALAGAGHACHLEQPDEFDDAILRFLRAHSHLAVSTHEQCAGDYGWNPACETRFTEVSPAPRQESPAPGSRG